MPTNYDNSQLQTFKDCPERYRLRYIEGLQKIEEGKDEHDKNFGKAIHSGLESYYKGKSEQDVREVFKLAYPEQLNQEDLAKTQSNGIVLLDAYAKHYSKEDKTFEVLSVEVKDSFKIGEIDFTVKIDMVVKKQGCVYFVDHKTTGKAFNWTYWNRFDPSSQISAYSAYCIQKYGECSGGIINAIRFGHHQRAYKGEPAGFHFEFQRQLFNRNKIQVEAWKKDQIKWTKKFALEIELEKQLSDGGVWTKNEGQCAYCSYKEVCISCNDDQIKEQLYERVNPEEYLNDNSGTNKVGASETNT